MKFHYKFSNLLGSVYKKGNVFFSPDGNCIFSPVGNRITVFDLKNNKSWTLPVESRFNFTAIDLSPNGSALIAVNEAGTASVVSMVSKQTVNKFEFKRPVCCIKFSPDGKLFAVCKENNVFIYKAPGNFTGDYNPMEMVRVFHGCFDETTCVDWTSDSRVIAVGSKDTSTKLYPLEKYTNFREHTLSALSDCVVAVFFEKDSLDVTTIGRNGQLCIWECSLSLSDLEPFDAATAAPNKKKMKKEGDGEEEEDDLNLLTGELRQQIMEELNEKKNEEQKESEDTDSKKRLMKLLAKHYLCDQFGFDKPKLTSAAYHKQTHILVTGFSNGAFLIHELPDVNLIHSMSISEQAITTVSLNGSGEWLALGCGGSSHGQLLVWEWQSETYVMKQQSHAAGMACLAYSIDGQYIATGGEDGKVKLWNTRSGFCFVTFSEHTSSVSAVRFANSRKFLVSASLDGTVRAFDMTRYRNFRTFTSPRPVQFVSLALDASGEFVAAGGQDVFEIYLWSMKVGRLLEVLTGHEGPVVGLAFSPVLSSTALASVSWDKTLRLWNAIESGAQSETIVLSSDGVSVAYKPDGKEVIVATLNGHLTSFEVESASQCSCIEGRNDLSSGRLEADLITAKKSLAGKSFNTVCYSADGEYVIAGGQSKHVCIYYVKEGLLTKKFEITQNRSLDAVDDFINRRKMTEFGNMALVEEREFHDKTEKTAVKLPGVRKGDMAARSSKPEIRVFQVQFSPTGQSWAAVTTEGLLIYSLDAEYMFDPYQLEMNITPQTVKQTLLKKEYSEAIMMALRLNMPNVTLEVFESIPSASIELCVSSLPQQYAQKSLDFIATVMENSRHIEYFMIWLESLLLKCDTPPLRTLLTVQRSVTRKYHDIAKICDYNKYTIKFLNRLGGLRNTKKMEDDEESMDMDREDDDNYSLAMEVAS
ncbi:periodic tryptophan protein 2 homolog [Nilaparvata lugens]|uniref:periodic tryptophan protein 2 homolog n=1 Tax=Nilaparvata lugens TaxID=108931 RepID=UPI00193CE175|nr:periodic tryptophan protein 2 homolog [Nilaparvata lugens]